MKLFWVILILFPFILHAQGPVDGFMVGPGNTNLALSFSSENSTKYFAGTKEIDLARDLVSISLFASHGISKKLDLIGNIPVINGKLQDGGIYIRFLAYESIKESGKLSIMPAVGISNPLSNYATETADAIGQQATVIYGKLIIQYMLENGFFCNATAGYNAAFEPTPQSIVASAKAGYASQKWYADLWVERQLGIGGKDYRGTGDLAASSFKQLGVSYNKLGATLFYSFHTKLGGFVSGGYTFDGRNTAKASRISAGIVYKFLKQ